MLLEMHDEGSFSKVVDGYETDYNYADFIDTNLTVDADLPFAAECPEFLDRYYEAVDIEGVAHCEEMIRDDALTFKGNYRIEISALREVCTSGWYANVQSASFELKEDADRFAASGAAGIKTVSDTVRQQSYTKPEADAERTRIRALAAENGWSTRKTAAYLAHVTRRIAKGA